ncbi:MAG: hypothetical protein Q9192_006056, partial [Flavoplaca navasiana]
MAENNSYTLAEGDNYGGVIAGQINFARRVGHGTRMFRSLLIYAADPSREREKIIAWLSPVDFWQKQDDVFSDAHPGTGQWLLDLQQFQRWLSGDPRDMWCHGAPGSGKTVITCIVVNHLRQLFSGKQEVGIAVLYCEWRQQEVQSPVNLLASIWNQLVVDKPLSIEVEALYKRTGSRVKPKYHDVLSILKSEIERLGSVYIILDALDELAEHNDCSKVLVEALSRLTPVSSQKVKILATSRSKRSVLARSELVHIVAKGEDIERFVEARFQQALKETMVVAIGKRANGLFLLARLFLDTLKHKTNLRDLRGAVQKLPQSINEHEIVAMLLSHGHNRLIEPSTIYCATYRENASIIESMIACTDDETRRRERLHQFLFHTASLGKLLVIQLAMRLGANVETKDNNGQMALGLAVRHGRPAAVELLLKIQAARTAQGTFEAGLLQLSASSREVIKERMRFVGNFGLDYAGMPQMRRDTDTKEERPSSMEEPIVLGNAFTQKLAVLLDDVDETELHRSSDFEHYEERYAPSELKDFIFDDGDHVQIMNMFLPYTVDVNELDPEGETILHHTVKGSSERVRTLVESFKGRLDIDSPDKKGRTPLHYAAAIGSTKTMKMLLAYGANIALRDDDHATTLHYSVNSSACTQLSIHHGVSLNDQDSFGRTALNYARLVRETNGKVQESLVRAGAEASAVDVRDTNYFRDIDSFQDIIPFRDTSYFAESIEDRPFIIQKDRSSDNRGVIDWLD